jgi:hypothetical protein
MNLLLEQPFQIPVNNWGFPNFMRVVEQRENDNWRSITGGLGTKLYWLLESFSFNLEYKIGDVSFHREYTLKIPIKPRERCCKVPLVQQNEMAGGDWYSTTNQFAFSPVMRLVNGYEHVNNIQHAKHIPLFATRFAYEEQDTYGAYSITTHPIDIKKRIIDQKRINIEESYLDLYLVSDVPDLIGKILDANLLMYFFQY